MSTKWFLPIVCLAQYLQAGGQSPTDVSLYIQTYKDVAISEMQRTGVPASITLAQGIHETLAGTSDLVKASNNHFGIKCKDGWTGAVAYHDDDSRGECFRSYVNPLDSYRDHSDFLRNSPRYGFLFKLDPLDYEGWAKGLRRAGYATNTQYAQILIRLVKDYSLQQFSLIALGRQNPYGKDGAVSPDSGVSDSKTSIFPEGEFQINHTRVVFAKEGSSLLGLAEQYNIPLSRLLDFNELGRIDALPGDQLLYLERKRKTGNSSVHLVCPGESLYGISQAEGIRLESLLSLNLLHYGDQPAAGQSLHLQTPAPARPLLALTPTVSKPAESHPE
jgi:hypothetical protein